MIDICMALDQSVSPHTGVGTIQNTGVFWQAGGISTASSLLPFFGTRLRRQNFNLAPTQYRQLRRLVFGQSFSVKSAKVERPAFRVRVIIISSRLRRLSVWFTPWVTL